MTFPSINSEFAGPPRDKHASLCRKQSGYFAIRSLVRRLDGSSLEGRINGWHTEIFSDHKEGKESAGVSTRTDVRIRIKEKPEYVFFG